jgi:hypothetical protein
MVVVVVVVVMVVTLCVYVKHLCCFASILFDAYRDSYNPWSSSKLRTA